MPKLNILDKSTVLVLKVRGALSYLVDFCSYDINNPKTNRKISTERIRVKLF